MLLFFLSFWLLLLWLELQSVLLWVGYGFQDLWFLLLFFFFNFKISVKKAMWLVSTNTFCKVSVCTTVRLIPMWIFPSLLYCLPRSQMDKENTWIERDSMTGRGRGDTLVWTSCWLWDNSLENEIKVICLNNTDNCFHLLKKKKRVRIW